ncbi:hypothetical protein ASG35_30595 [Burkholderia sp. Leaf177]|uniref:esterase/lipase family protein n=1 Tax=Burkholderia sp. Leaf177 TaxID=1736287 RepID=UPI0006F367BF|nr:hypothetical protein [Burkholderia sp. Leaf177]KQR80019.1 hypothetical protein ASG35_30595 [Burkholderia sp. Leaf177]
MSDLTSKSTPEADSIIEGSENDAVRLLGGFDSDGMPAARAVLTPDSDQRGKEIHFDPRQPIPVIFLPGVMGTLLADKDTGGTVWRPPNMDAFGSAISGAISIVAGWFANAAKRAKLFDPEQAIVDPRGPVEVGDSGLSEDEARRRGWSTVHRWSYQPTLAWLQNVLDNPMAEGQPIGEWAHGDPKAEGKMAALKSILGTDPADYGAYGSGRAITLDSDVFRSLTRYRYPVYAIGYNWLQSNLLSGQQVLDGIDFQDPHGDQIIRIMGIREICLENQTDKAIIITHSMGGLVARMASQLCGGKNDMYGVIHGAQPATGAPLFAKRFRTGGEDFINKSLMGRDAAEFIAIASNAEGPMELSPMPDYNNGDPWWIFVDKNGKQKMALPIRSALDELYISDKWYGLIPDTSVLDPAGIIGKQLEDQKNKSDVFDHFKKTMRGVVKRQEILVNNYHPNTYAMYGDGALKPKFSGSRQYTPRQESGLPSEELMTWGSVVWQGDIPDGVSEDELKAAVWIGKERDDRQGVLKIVVGGQTVVLTVQKTARRPKDGDHENGIIPGDGTVPSWSAESQGRGLIPGSPHPLVGPNGVKMIFVQGGYEHQFCYAHTWTRWATLYSVAQIAHSIEANGE